MEALKRIFMVSDHALEKLSLDELIDLLVVKTTQYLELMDQRNGDAMRLRNLKLELDMLHTIICHKKSVS